jgi:hypothetical protein
MIDLEHAVQERGFTVAHIKTDSIKIPDATDDIIEFITTFAKEYGYDFERDPTYEKFCLVNDAVFVARSINFDYDTDPDNVWKKKWTAVGAQFQHPYVFKTLFSKEEIQFGDFCETKSVSKGRIYLGDIHIGRTGSFMPVRYDGYPLWRVDGEKKHHVAGTKDYIWIERTIAQHRFDIGELFTDMDYFEHLKNDAVSAIEEFVPYEELIKE